MSHYICTENRTSVHYNIKRELEAKNEPFEVPIVLYYGLIDEKWERHFFPKFGLIQVSALHFWKEYTHESSVRYKSNTKI